MRNVFLTKECDTGNLIIHVGEGGDYETLEVTAGEALTIWEIIGRFVEPVFTRAEAENLNSVFD